MDEKHKMLYPPINASASGAGSSTSSAAAAPTAAQIKSATAEMGLPIEPPPTYDFAMASTAAAQPVAVPVMTVASPAPAPNANNAHWQASAPITATEVVMHQPHTFEPTLAVIVEQPMQPPQQQQQYLPQQQQQFEAKQQPQFPQAQHYQPQYQQQQQQQQQQQHTTAVPSTIITPPPNLGPHPCKVTCPACGANKTTRMCFTPNSRTHLCALFLCLVGWCCCACFVPYCMTSCRTGNHYCVKCNTYLGTFNPNQRK